ncbi:MAG: glycosyltransferase family 4 protein [Syntrophorhabdales bacterium]|jgi:glycosyltransferase involved in cell wall biosynthesis
MKCLHLFSDWKWTGPAEPVVSLCEALERQGVDVRLAFRKAPPDFAERTVGKEIVRRGVSSYDGFRLNRYFSTRDWLFDFRAIRRYAVENRFDIIHAHLTHDHSLAALSLFGCAARPLLVRTDHKRDGLDRGFAMKMLLGRTDGLAAYAETIRARDVKHLVYPEERTVVLPPGVHVYGGPTEDLRASLGIGKEEKIIGVIGRLKPDRGYDVVLRAFKGLKERMDGVKLVIVGRSSQIEESVKKPLAALGLDRDVILAGYRRDDYFSMIATFDLFVMMRAGSDGTARALREVMGMGKPAIVSDRGMLPELVRDGHNGYVVSDEHELAARMEQVLADEGLRERLGAEARKTAAREWDYGLQATKLAGFYEALLTRGRRAG